MSMHELYHKKIMDHYHNSPFRGTLKEYDFITDQVSPSCGDRVVFTVACNNDMITDIKFHGDGSIIGQAAASLLCEKVIGLSFQDVLVITPEDMIHFLGIELGHTRKRTVAFTLETLQKGVRDYVESRKAL